MSIRLIDGMRAVATAYDGFILDLWGVVHDGTAPFPGVLDCMERLIGADKRLVLLSNAPRRSDGVGRRIARIGVPERPQHAVMACGAVRRGARRAVCGDRRRGALARQALPLGI